MSYLIKEKMMRDKSDQSDSVTSTSATADSVVAIEENFSVNKIGRIEEHASFETKMKNIEVAAYPHFPADNIAEVWLNIFEKLEADDKITFSKTCHEWNDWVASKKTCFLFSEVVHMLVQITNLPARELLRCRTMCKSWTSDFNRVYPAHPSHLRLESEIDEVEENKIIKLENHFTSSQQIHRFLEVMRYHPGNLFPGRSICLAFELRYETTYPRRADRLRLIQEFYGTAIELVESFGSHVHMAKFDLWPHGSWINLEVLETYNYFRRCLLHMPNLKKLVVSGHPDWPYLDEEPELAFYRQNTLPQLPYLETVSINFTPHAIWNGVLEASCVPSNVKRLNLSPEETEDLRIPELAYFPNLEVLDLKLPGVYLEQFLNNLNTAPIPPVSIATLYCWDDEQDFGRIFRSLEAFAGSLTYLTLSAEFTEESFSDAIETGIDINLPKLERLKLIEYNRPLDPFFKLPVLKFLTIMCYEFQPWEEDKVDFWGFEVSNIWEQFPFLQELHIESTRPNGMCETYHRDKFQLSLSE